MISFDVTGIPTGEGRPRAFIRGGHARQAPCTVADDWKALVAIEAKKHLPAVPLQGPLHVSVEFRFSRPKKHFRTGKLSDQLRDDAPGWHIGRPDRDNLDKAVLDVLTQVGMWEDDCQVCGGTIMKRFVLDGERPGATVVIESAAVNGQMTAKDV